MENPNLKEMKSSKVFRIIAAVMEVMEKSGFKPDLNTTLEESKTNEGHWKMTFQKHSTNYDELCTIKNEMGENFNITVEPKDKNSICVILEAPKENFCEL